MQNKSNLLGEQLKVINIGLEQFATTLKGQNVPVVHLDWRPPAGGDARLNELMRQLQDNVRGKTGASVDDANQTAVGRLMDGDPVLVDIVPAGEVIPALRDSVLLHAGPPIPWDEMCDPMRGAVLCGIRYEGWATTDAEAQSLVDGGKVRLQPNHDFDAVGPMTGITSESMPVFVVENRSFGNRAYCTINEGIGKVLRFGANDDQVVERLRWLQNVFSPTLREAVLRAEGIDLRPIMARALSMGDEMHQRNVAATSLFFREVAPHLIRTSGNSENLGEVVDFLTANDQFFLNLVMAAGKAIMDPVGDIPGSTVVSAMSRNGRDFGIRVSGTGSRWYTAPSLMPDGLYFPGYTAEDANPDMGDSAIIETMGLGGFSMAGSPPVVGFVGAGTFQDAVGYTREMGEITLGHHPQMSLPTLDFQGTPCGIDVLKVVESGITPVINTGIAHRKAGVGQVGAGIVRAPMDCFTQALEGLAEHMRESTTGQDR